MCACVVCVVMWSSLVCLRGCLGTLCEHGGCGTVMYLLFFVLHVCLLIVFGCEGDGSAGVGGCGDVVVVSAGHEYVGVHVVQVLCLAPLMC